MAEWKCCYAGCDFVITDEDKDLLKLSAQSHIAQHANANSSITQSDRTESKEAWYNNGFHFRRLDLFSFKVG